MAALLAVVLAAGNAWAATGNSVSISGPRQVHPGEKVKLHFTGYATANVRRLQVWLDDQRCADSAQAEGTRAGLQAPTSFHVHGQFRALLTIERSSAGIHVVCAYLLERVTQASVARASWRYVTQ